MFFTIDHDTITTGIQLALTPVFLLTAVAGMIAAVAARLSRIMDRAHVLEGQLDATHNVDNTAALHQQLGRLKRRAKLINSCIALLTLCAILISVTIVVLFLAETTALQMLRIATICFLSGVSCFVFALLCFLGETLLASQILKFSPAPKRKR
jgi:hypothetical protein